MIRKVQRSEFVVIFASGGVVGLSGVDFIVEIADELRFSVEHYSDCPSFLVLVPGQAFVF